MPILISNTIASSIVSILYKVKYHYINQDESDEFVDKIDQITNFFGFIKVMPRTNKYDIEPLDHYFTFITECINVFQTHNLGDTLVYPISKRAINTIYQTLR